MKKNFNDEKIDVRLQLFASAKVKRIAGCCASSSECSDHILDMLVFSFFHLSDFILHNVIIRSELKTRI